jgi:hypothetical protein
MIRNVDYNCFVHPGIRRKNWPENFINARNLINALRAFDEVFRPILPTNPGGEHKNYKLHFVILRAFQSLTCARGKAVISYFKDR